LLAAESAAFLLNGGGGGLLGSFPNKVGDVSYDDYTDDPVTPWPDVPVVIRSSADPWVSEDTGSGPHHSWAPS